MNRKISSFVVILLIITVLKKECGIFKFNLIFEMLVTLAINHLLMQAALTLLDYKYLCRWCAKSKNKIFKSKYPINWSISSVETSVPGERPIQAILKISFGVVS